VTRLPAAHVEHGAARLGAATAGVGLVAWLVTEYAMTGRLPLSADSSA
jgi:hypothetical protein